MNSFYSEFFEMMKLSRVKRSMDSVVYSETKIVREIVFESFYIGIYKVNLIRGFVDNSFYFSEENKKLY